MRTRDFRKFGLAVLLLVAFVSYNIAREKENRSKFYYDNIGAKTLAESQTICVLDEGGQYLRLHIKYDFAYDENDRVITKKALKWDDNKKIWVNSYLMNYSYSDDSMTIELAYWDKQKEAYDECTERAFYEVDAGLQISYSYYKRDLPNGSWNLEYSQLVSVPEKPIWLEKTTILAESEK